MFARAETKGGDRLKGQTKVSNLALLLTAGVVKRNGELEPDDAGKMRCRKAMEAYVTRRAQRIAIVGGVGLGELSFAKIYYRWMQKIYPDVPIAFIDASANCTPRDLSADSFLDKVRELFPDVSFRTLALGIISYSRHCSRAMLTLAKAGFVYFDLIESGEKPAYGWLTDYLLLRYTRYDPIWERFVGRKLVEMADSNVCRVLRE